MSQDDQHSAEVVVFADDGMTRHRMVRAGVAAGALLLAGWLVALALGALGGFEALPSLPDRSSDAAGNATSSEAVKPGAAEPGDRAARDRDRSLESTGSGSPSRQQAAPPTSPVNKPKPAPTVVTTTTKPGKRIGTTQASGKPVGSPGNGPGGTGPPGLSP
jgi:hypothetical protein